MKKPKKRIISTAISAVKGRFKKLPVINELFVREIIDAILKQAIEGAGPFKSAEELAAEYISDKKLPSTEEKVNSLIRWESSKNFGMGFVTGLGGLVTLPVTIPASLYSSWVVQARLAAAIACLYGHSTAQDRVRTFIMLCVIGDAGKQVLKNSGVDIAQRFALNACKRVPDKLLAEINKKVGFKLLSSAGEKGMVTLARLVPFFGGILSGIIDSASCFIVGRTARRTFGPGAVTDTDKRTVIRVPLSEISRIVTARTKMVKSLEINADKIICMKLARLPLKIKLRYAGYLNGNVRLEALGNPLTKALVKRGVGSIIRRLPPSLAGDVFMEKQFITIRLNAILERELDSLEELSVVLFDIVDREIVIELA